MTAISRSYVEAFRLLYQIRAGRYAQVWAAIDDSRGQRACLKLLLPEYRRDREQLRSFRREFEVGRTLRHPLLLGARDLRESRQGPYLLMELFTSRNLREVIHECREAVLQWLPSIAVQLAEAVAYLHSLNWLHLDLKPDNVLLNEHGEIRLIDFSLARKMPGTLERIFRKHARDGAIRGTRSYMAPEQIHRKLPDERTDVYSLGCTLYHLAAGVAPYVGGTSNELLRQHLQARVPNLTVDQPDATPAFARLIAGMMSKKPGERPSSARAVVDELRSIRILHRQSADPAASPTVAAAPV